MTEAETECNELLVSNHPGVSQALAHHISVEINRHGCNRADIVTALVVVLVTACEQGKMGNIARHSEAAIELIRRLVRDRSGAVVA